MNTLNGPADLDPTEQATMLALVNALLTTHNQFVKDYPAARHPLIITLAVVAFAANVVAHFLSHGDVVEWHDKVIHIHSTATMTFEKTLAANLAEAAIAPMPRTFWAGKGTGVARD